MPMRERPILFSGPMVWAILSGRKTQTRRVVKCKSPFEVTEHDETGKPWPWVDDHVPGCDLDGWLRCPYGLHRDRLWVRETWMPGYYHEADHENGPRVSLIYRADEAEVTVQAPSYELAERWDREFSEDGHDVPPWRSPIHMPRWASRILLEVTDVRVERLQAISAEDCIAEGISTTLREHDAVCHLRDQYRALWESINGPGSWDANPWVWAITFRRLESHIDG